MSDGYKAIAAFTLMIACLALFIIAVSFGEVQ